MIICLIILTILLIIVIAITVLLYKKTQYTDYENELMIFVVDMYLNYGESIEIFPNDESKEILINKIKALKDKIEINKNKKLWDGVQILK